MSAQIPHRQTLYKIAYDVIRTAECQNQQDLHSGYEQCNRSYLADYHQYKLHRDHYMQHVRAQQTRVLPGK